MQKPKWRRRLGCRDQKTQMSQLNKGLGKEKKMHTPKPVPTYPIIETIAPISSTRQRTPLTRAVILEGLVEQELLDDIVQVH